MSAACPGAVRVLWEEWPPSHLPAMSPWPTSASPLSWLSALLGDIPDGTTVTVLGREFWGLFGLSKMENYKGLRITWKIHEDFLSPVATEHLYWNVSIFPLKNIFFFMFINSRRKKYLFSLELDSSLSLMQCTLSPQSCRCSHLAQFNSACWKSPFQQLSGCAHFPLFSSFLFHVLFDHSPIQISWNQRDFKPAHLKCSFSLFL